MNEQYSGMMKNFSKDCRYRTPESLVVDFLAANVLCGSADSTISDLTYEDYGEI